MQMCELEILMPSANILFNSPQTWKTDLKWRLCWRRRSARKTWRGLSKSITRSCRRERYPHFIVLSQYKFSKASSHMNIFPSFIQGELWVPVWICLVPCAVSLPSRHQERHHSVGGPAEEPRGNKQARLPLLSLNREHQAEGVCNSSEVYPSLVADWARK